MNKRTLTILSMVLSTVLLAGSLWAANPSAEQKRALMETNQKFMRAVRANLVQQDQLDQLREAMIVYSPQKKIDAFLSALENAEARGIDARAVLTQYLAKRAKRHASGGAITGTTDASNSGALALAFNRYGFLAGAADVDQSTGRFTISGLASGPYDIVLTSGVGGQVRPKSLTVVDGQVTNAGPLALSQISPAKASAAGNPKVTGSIKSAAGAVVPLGIAFAFNAADSSFGGVGISLLGDYEMSVISAGTYIFYADSYLDLSIEFAPGFSISTQSLLGEYYNNSPTPGGAMAQTLAENDSLPGINFSLEIGGVISGSVQNESGLPLDSVFVLAIRKFEANNLKLFSEEIDLAVTTTDQNGNFFATGLRSGEYVLRTLSLINTNLIALLDGNILGKHAGLVLDQYYGGSQNLLDFDSATSVTVSGSDTTSGVDFSLELAGAIAGKFVEASDGVTPITGTGTAVVFNAATGIPELAITIYDTTTGNYQARPLADGQYKVLGLEANLNLFGEEEDTGEDVVYLPQFYNGQVTFDAATTVSVTQPMVTPDIDFNMLRAGFITGTITLPGQPSEPVKVTVAAYDVSTGALVDVADIDHTEDYKLTVPAGAFKVESFSRIPGQAATYYGGGNSFDDANSQSISVNFGETATANITLAEALGSISGTVYNQDGSIQLPGVLVLVYDATGHVISGAISGLDLTTGQPFGNPGQYQAHGILSGSYYVRTFALYQILGKLDELGAQFEGQDPLTALLGGGLNLDALGGIGLDFYGDLWYNSNVSFSDISDVNLISLLLNIIINPSASLLQPFFSVPAGDAGAVTVTSPNATENINFNLPVITGIISSVDGGGEIPTSFKLSQNFPNPFNPSTVVTYKVPETADITINVYNMLGQKIRTLFDGIQQAGSFTIQWDARDDRNQPVAGGIYFMRLEAGSTALSRKMILLK